MLDNIPTAAEYLRILPELILIIVGTLIMFLEAVLKDDQKGIYGPLSIAGLIAAVVAAIAVSVLRGSTTIISVRFLFRQTRCHMIGCAIQIFEPTNTSTSDSSKSL